MLLAGLIWGMGFIAQETAMNDIGPFLFMTLRFALAALAILPLVIWERKKHGNRSLTAAQWISIVSVGLVFFPAMALQQVGLLATSVTNAGVLTGLYVVLVPIIMAIAFAQKQSAIIWPCAVASFLGIWLLGGGGLGLLSWGDWLVLLGALFAALHLIAVGFTVVRLGRPATVAATQFAVSAVFAFAGLIIARYFDWSYEPSVNIDAVLNAAPEIAYAAFFAGALAFTIMAFCQQYANPATAAILLSSEALFAALGGAVLLGERLSLTGYLGCALLFTAIGIVSVASAQSD